MTASPTRKYVQMDRVSVEDEAAQSVCDHFNAGTEHATLKRLEMLLPGLCASGVEEVRLWDRRLVHRRRWCPPGRWWESFG